ncbi:uncharacterized protein LOC112493602 isoform X2 [Cephus cinctus]|uniref:Uncharacterized protein LOC112493602 isoform X2 n=1 Tax=Cephus cinctus TaxID=211228 RepID=A0AAJ7VYQ0_CEPCN|nr:uncharacterized protein LOC112493602 isoform X2 [Cephus cinctus]
MSEEIILKALSAGGSGAGSGSIPFADEDGSTVASTPGRGQSRIFSKEELIYSDVTPRGEATSRNAANFTSFRNPILKSNTESNVAGKYCASSNEVGINNKEVSGTRIALKKSRTDSCVPEADNPLQRYENALLKYQRIKVPPKKQISRENSYGYSSSDESVIRNKSKSTSSIDTQSVNNILDEYEDLDYRRSSDLSDVGSIDVTNFEAVMDQQRQREKSKMRSPMAPAARNAGPPLTEKLQPLLKVNQQTQVRQRSRDRLKDSGRIVPVEETSGAIAGSAGKTSAETESNENSVGKVPDLLMRKGEVQKRVDEWLSQTQSQNFVGVKDKVLVRSNSSADYRYRNSSNSRARSVEEAGEKLNGTVSYDDLNREGNKGEVKADKVSIGVNTSRGTYKEYLAARSKMKQNDYGFSGSNGTRSTRDMSPGTTSKIPQRGFSNSSFRSRKTELSTDSADSSKITCSFDSRVTRERSKVTENRLANQTKSRAEPEPGKATSTIIPSRRPSFKRTQSVNQRAGVLIKEERSPRARPTTVSSEKGPSSGDRAAQLTGQLTGQLAALPNMDGESQRPLLPCEAPVSDADRTDPGKPMEGSYRDERNLKKLTTDSVEPERTVKERVAVRSSCKVQPKIESSSRLDSIYGPVEPPRLRTLLHGQVESSNKELENQSQLAPIPRTFQGPNAFEGRKLPAIPRKDQSQTGNENYVKCTIINPVSTFKPNNAMYATLQQPSEQNSFATTIVNESVTRSHYATPKHIEKIYERAQPQVIHADDLESILKPVALPSAYGDKLLANERKVHVANDVGNSRGQSDDEDIYEKISDVRFEQLETIVEDQKSDNDDCRFPEIGLSQCLKVQQKMPNGKVKSSGFTESTGKDAIYAKPWDQTMILNDPPKTFSTFQTHHQDSATRLNHVNQSRRTCPAETNESEGLSGKVREQNSEPSEDMQESCDGNSLYEVRSTLRLTREQLGNHSREGSSLSSSTVPLENLKSDSQREIVMDNRLCSRPVDDISVGESRSVLEKKCTDDTVQLANRINRNKSERDLEERDNELSMKDKIDLQPPIVSEILVKTLKFKQDLPIDLPKISEPVLPTKQFNFHNVLSDDYDKILAQDAMRLKESKVYVTKEEMEHQKLMDLLKKGDYDAVKSIRITLDSNCRTPTTSTGIGSSITDEIWTSANERKFFRTSTTSTGIGSSLNLQDNNRSLESRDGDFYSTDIEDSKDTYRRFYPNTPTTSGLGSSSDRQSVETQRSRDLPDHLWAAAMEDGFSRFNAMKSLQTITRQPRPNHDWVRTERISRFTKHRTISQSPQREQEIWTTTLNDASVSGYATQRNPMAHRCHHQARRSFSTSIVADLAVTPNGSQQSLGSGEFLELERSYTLSTPGGSSPVCCPPCSPPPAPAAYISSARASSRRLGVGNALGGAPSPERDPLGRLLRFLKTFYRELGTRDPPHLPQWALPLPLGTLCPAHFQPHLQLVHKSEQEHLLENIRPEQIFAPVRLSDGTIAEAPRRVAVEGGPGSGRTTLCLRLLHQWATQGDGPALAFIVPLRELRGSPLLNYLARELFPRTAALGDAVAQVWRTLHLIEDRVLFVLDGYDECVGGRASLGDAVDLLEGRLFPDARLLVTCSPNNSPTLSPLVQRRIHLAGLEWPHVERLCVAYFIHNDVAERACEFLEALNVQPQAVKQLGQHPLGWIMLCSLYQDSGSLPTETSALVQAAVKCIVKRSLDPPVPYNEEIPGHCRKRLEDFGKLSLAALREGRCCYTEAELRARGGGIEVTRLGFLTRGLTFGQRRKPDLYTPIHMAVAEFLAAYYLTSVAQYANILRRELEGLPGGIISHLAGLLGPKTHLILNQLCPLEVPPRAVFSLLKAAGASDGNISAVCRLVGAGPGFGPAPNERPPSPLVHTVPLELEGWARILKSAACTLEALELVFQIERGSDPRYLDEFFEALAGNESVKLVRITSLLGQESSTEEAQRLAGHLKSVLGKKKLNDFELVITCLEESAHDGLECVVNALCRGLSHASVHLARLVLDMNLSGKQVSRVCEALRDCVQVQALHLPHLSCGCEGLASVAELLKERPLLALNIAGCWGAKNEDPSSSGISSGSGSGSSGCASSTLGTLPLNRCCSSLPRGALAAYGSLTRPATLPRLPFGLGLGPGPVNGTGPLPVNDRDRDSNGSSKRNSDSVLCHRVPLLHPLPTCDASSHQGTGFHEIFNAIREPNCKLRSLNVSKCLVGGLDAECLGETIRKARNLDALRAAGASRPADVMPLVKALMEAPCLQLLDLASSRLALDDNPSRLLCHALVRNGTLRLLSLEGWTFRIEESDSLALFSELLRYTSVRELNLCNARLHLAVHEGPLARLGRRDDAGAELLRAAPPAACPVIVFLRLAGFQVTVNDRLALRGPLLLPFLAGFTALSELDLSLDKSAIGGSSDTLLFIDDKILQQFFGCLSSHFRNLQSLSINFWRISLEDSDKTMRQIAKYLKLCNLSFLRANGLNVTDSAKKVQMEHIFVQTLLTNLQYLTWLCLDGVDLTETQASSVGKCVRDRYPGTNLEISAKDVNVKSVKALVAAIEEGGRAEVLYTGGSNCRLKITKLQKNGRNKKK